MNAAVSRNNRSLRHPLTVASSVIAASLLFPAAVFAQTATTVTPVIGPQLSGTSQVLSAGSAPVQSFFGQRISGGVAVYTGNSDAQVHYNNLATGVDQVVPQVPLVPPAIAYPTVPDISGTHIAFYATRGTGYPSQFTESVMLFDLTTQTLVQLDSTNGIDVGPGIGASTLAYVKNHYSDPTTLQSVDLIAYDLTTASATTVTTLTAGVTLNWAPRVAPDGSTIVWSQCTAASPFTCDIWEATRNGTSWIVSQLTDTAAQGTSKYSPDTDGTTVVYSVSTGGSSLGPLGVRPVAGGTELLVDFGGFANTPTIRNGIALVSNLFDSQNYPLVAYDVARNVVYSLAGVNGLWQDFERSATGNLTVAWWDYDLYAHSGSFQLPDSNCPNALFSPAPTSPFAVGTHPSAAAAGDFNGDGKLDLVLANSGSHSVSVLLGDGAGSFGTSTSYPVNSGAAAAGIATHVGPSADPGPVALAAGDFNGDGKLDLAVASDDSTNISILLGNGDGSFGSATNFAVGATPHGLAIADFDGDGKLDLAVTTLGSGGNALVVLRGNGDGTFGAPTSYSVGQLPVSVAVGDFNGDGKLDLAVANAGDGTVSILRGVGDGTFIPAPGSPLAVGSLPLSVAVGDFNNDGILDLVVANYGDNSVSVLIGTGTGSFAAANRIPVSIRPASVSVADFNADGRQDIVVADSASGTSAAGDISVLLGDGTGSFLATAGNPFAVGRNPVGVAVGDFNGDGNPDLAIAVSTDNTAALLLSGCNAVTPVSRPVIAAHADVTTEATSAAGASTSYSSPATTDTLDGPGIATCTPASGSVFALGNTTVTCRAVNSHGNAAIATTFVVHVVDTSPPLIAPHADLTVEATSAAGAYVTYASPMTTDAVDGIRVASCSPGSPFVYPPKYFTLGDTTVTCTAADSHGNAAVPTTFVVHVVDTTPPAISSSQMPPPNGYGWNKSDVTVSFTATDLVGSAACSPASLLVQSQGANQSIGTTCTDWKGNAAAASRGVNIDKTPPTLSTTLSPIRASNGSLTGTLAAFSCADTLSGIATCPAPITMNFGTSFLTSLNRALNATATDKAGNSNTSACSTLDQLLSLIATAAGKSITAAQAASLDATVNRLKTGLRCP